MKNGYLTLILLFSTLSIFGQSKIEWSENYSLQADDFMASAPNTGTMQSVYGYTTIEYQLLNYQVLFSKNFNDNVISYFHRSASWLDKGENANQLLRYSQILFDMSEWMARELRKRFRENRKMLLSGKQNEIYDQVIKEFAEIQSQFARETSHGQDLEKLSEWQTKVRNELDKLRNYCKTCKKR